MDLKVGILKADLIYIVILQFTCQYLPKKGPLKVRKYTAQRLSSWKLIGLSFSRQVAYELKFEPKLSSAHLYSIFSSALCKILFYCENIILCILKREMKRTVSFRCNAIKVVFFLHSEHLIQKIACPSTPLRLYIIILEWMECN